MLQCVSHIGIAVGDLKEATRFYTETLGLAIYGFEDLPHYGVEMAFMPIGDIELELVVPTSPYSPVAKFLRERGPGFHHIAYHVEDVAKEFSRLQSLGVRMVDDGPRPGPHNTLCAFVHPKAAGGVLIELVQELGGDEPGASSPAEP